MARVYGANPNHWQAYCDYGVSSTDTTTTITISAAGFRSVAWGFQLSSGVSVTAACTGQTSKSGSGGFTSGTGATVEKSFVSGSWAVARTTSAQTLTVTVTVTNSSGYMNGTSTLSFQVTIPALPSYTISYNANSGTGAPSAQTKWYGSTLKISSVVPSRTGYIFQGWATSSTGAVAYQAGANYTANASATLYAVWKIGYIAPTISACSASRCNSAGTLADAGTYAKVTASWSVSTTYNASNKATKITVEYRKSGASAWTSGATQTPNAVSGTLSVVVGGGGLGVDNQYEFRVTVTDSGGSSTATCSVASQYFPMDIGNKGKTVAFGKAASTTAGLEVGMVTRFDDQTYLSRSSGDAFYNSTNASTGVGVGFGVGSGGANHGLWSKKLGKWLVHGDASKVYVAGMNFSDAASARSSIGAPTHHSSGSWKWIKWNDGSGRVEAWHRGSVGSVAMTSSYYDRFWFAAKDLAFPMTFKDIYLCQLTSEVSGDIQLVSLSSVTTTKCSYYVGCLGRAWTATVILNAHVVGIV